MGLSTDWQTIKLGEICKTSSGGTPSRMNKSFYNEDIPWVKSGELNFNTIRDAEEREQLTHVYLALKKDGNVETQTKAK